MRGSFIAESLHRFEPARAPGGNDAAECANDPGAAANDQRIFEKDEGWKFGKLVDGRRKKREAEDPIHEMEEFITISQREPAKPVTGEIADRADERALAQKEAGDLKIGRAERFEHADFAGFLDDER